MVVFFYKTHRAEYSYTLYPLKLENYCEMLQSNTALVKCQVLGEPAGRPFFHVDVIFVEMSCACWIFQLFSAVLNQNISSLQLVRLFEVKQFINTTLCTHVRSALYYEFGNHLHLRARN